MNRFILSFLLCFPGAWSLAQATFPSDDLTPVGAERAGNKAGTIPPWTGGITQPPASYRPGYHETDPFPGDTPLFRIDAGNADQYAEHLTPGQRALLERYPDVDMLFSNFANFGPDADPEFNVFDAAPRGWWEQFDGAFDPDGFRVLGQGQVRHLHRYDARNHRRAA